MKAIKTIFQFLIIVILLALFNAFISTTEFSKKRIKAIIKIKHPSYQIITLTPEYSDWSSTVCEADDYNNPEFATVVIKNEEEQRTIYLDKNFGIWTITNDEPDYGKNVPDDVYFIEKNCAHVGKRTDIEEEIKSVWIIPDENGEPYQKSGGDDWYYSYHYIENMYKTKNGNIYILNKSSLEWERTDFKYSYMVYYANYQNISKDEAEKLISGYRNSHSSNS